jgi:Permeases of the drug/metabolite transporter (DMT) superfamily
MAIRLSGGATAVVLLYTAPVWVAFFSRLLFKERITRRKALAVGIALSGTALVCFSGGSLPGKTSAEGIAFGLLSGLCYASHYPFYRWWQVRYSTATIYAYMNKENLPVIHPCIKCGQTPKLETSRPEGRTHDIYRLACACGNFPLQWSVSESAAIRLWNSYVAS